MKMFHCFFRYNNFFFFPSQRGVSLSLSLSLFFFFPFEGKINIMLHTKIPGTIQLQEPSLWNKLCGRWNDRQNDKEQLIKTKILKQSKGFLFYFTLLLEIIIAKLFSPRLWIAFTFSSQFYEEHRFKFWWNLIDFFYHLFCLCLV